jgi:hypothetical protein
VEDLFRTFYADQAPRAVRERRRKEKKEESYDYRDYYTRGSAGKNANPQGFDPKGRSHW